MNFTDSRPTAFKSKAGRGYDVGAKITEEAINVTVCMLRSST